MKGKIHYDIIADIHGRFDKLVALLERLGYARSGDRFVPPAGHKALFLGDLIDPKPGHDVPGGVRAVLRLVKAMCDAGEALCLMGNHELNAIYFHSRGPNGEWMRHHGDKNVRMHAGSLADFPDYLDPESEWQAIWLPWMKRLPIFLDLGDLRAVHAAWHPEMIARVAGQSFENPEFFLAAADKHSPEGEALEILLKGIEVPLPPPHFFIDHTGAERRNIRARWWRAPGPDVHCRDLVFPANDQIPAVPVPQGCYAAFQPYPESEPPLFFGHYFKPADAPLHPEEANLACLDHSGAKDGPLVAYRWKGEPSINPDHYFC